MALRSDTLNWKVSTVLRLAVETELTLVRAKDSLGNGLRSFWNVMCLTSSEFGSIGSLNTSVISMTSKLMLNRVMIGDVASSMTWPAITDTASSTSLPAMSSTVAAGNET